MKKLLLSTIVASLCTFAQAEKISDEEKKQLLDLVEKALVESETAVKKKNRNIHKLLKKAAKDKQERTELFHDAVKEINFTSQGKKHSDFVAWKKANREWLSDKTHQQWLQIQVQWLNFAVESKNLTNDGFKKEFIVALTKYMNNFYEGIEKLSKDSKDVGINLNREFGRNYMQSEISKYLGIQHATNASWPHNPTKIADIYNKHIFPFIRDLKDINLLKSAWVKRIENEATLIEALHGVEKKGLRAEKAGIVIRQFNTKVKPKLIWEMYTDLYKHGDEKFAASKMVQHIKSHRTHPDAPAWARSLITLLTPSKTASTTATTSE